MRILDKIRNPDRSIRAINIARATSYVL